MMTAASRTSARILLIRHGRSAHARTGGWLDAAAYRQWRSGYDDAAIPDNELPPHALIAAVRDTTIISSDLPRAIASAERLAPAQPIEISAQLRETVLDVPELPLRFPIAGWEVLVHAQWAWRIVRGSDARIDELRRARNAATWLAYRAASSPDIAVITHGVFRRLLGRALVKLGWTPASAWRRYRPWSVWSFTARQPIVAQQGAMPP